MSEQNTAYSLGVKISFCLLWATGLLVFLLFGLFAILTLGAPMSAVWNMLIAAAEVYLLLKLARHFRRKDKAASELLLMAAIAAIAIPLLATGGCLVISEMGKGLRFAG